MRGKSIFSGHLATFVLVNHNFTTATSKLNLSTSGAIQMFQKPILSLERLKKIFFFVKREAERLNSQSAVLMEKELVILGVFGTFL